MGFRLSRPAMIGELVKARGSLHRMTDQVARRDAATRSTTQLVAFLGDNADHSWTPPVDGLAAALGHDVVHGLDITVALALGASPGREGGTVVQVALRAEYQQWQS